MIMIGKAIIAGALLLASPVLAQVAVAPSPQAAAAPTPERMKLAGELIGLLNFDNNIANTRRQWVETSVTGLRNQLTAGGVVLAPSFYTRVQAVMDEEFGKQVPAMRNAAIATYASQFSETELSQLIAHYKTDLGKLMLAKMGPANQASSEALGRVVTEIGQAAQPRLQALLEPQLRGRRIVTPSGGVITPNVPTPPSP
jgi:hypothetical protein